jgi:hypothetical protein
VQLGLRFEFMAPAVMKNLAIITLAIATAVSAPAFARTNTDDKADCENASGIWDWINTKCLASMDLTRPIKCNHPDGNTQDSGECTVKSAGHQSPTVSE